jgi:hypothetical protein
LPIVVQARTRFRPQVSERRERRLTRCGQSLSDFHSRPQRSGPSPKSTRPQCGNATQECRSLFTAPAAAARSHALGFVPGVSQPINEPCFMARICSGVGGCASSAFRHSGGHVVCAGCQSGSPRMKQFRLSQGDGRSRATGARMRYRGRPTSSVSFSRLSVMRGVPRPQFAAASGCGRSVHPARRLVSRGCRSRGRRRIRGLLAKSPMPADNGQRACRRRTASTAKV